MKWGALPAIALQLLLLSRFLRPANRNYPLAILYTVLLIFLTAGAVVVQVYRDYFSYLEYLTLAEITMHFILLGLMLQLTHRTLVSLHLPINRVWGLAVLSAALLIGAYFLTLDLEKGDRFVKIRQVFSFWMVLVNLHWWTLLLRRRILDKRVLLLSAGVGLQMTGQVISDGLYALPKVGTSKTLILLTYVVAMSTHLASLYSWFEAFSPKNAIAEHNPIPSNPPPAGPIMT